MSLDNKNDVYSKHCTIRPTCYSVEDVLSKESTGITSKTYYINYTNMNLTVITRDGLKQHVKHTVGKFSGEFIIRTEYFLPAPNIPKIQEFLIRADDNNDLSGDLKAFKDAFFLQYDYSHFKNIRIVVECVVSQTDIREYQNLYVLNRDVVISTFLDEEAPDHPYSKRVLLEERYKELTTNTHGIGFSIDIVDNEGDLVPRYLYVARRLLKIQPFKDIGRESGVYLGVTDFDSSGKLALNTLHLNIEEASERIGLYKTREEAMSAGDIKSLRSEELAKLTHEISLKNLEIQKIRQENQAYSDRIKDETTRKEFFIKQATLHLEEKIKQKEQENKLLDAEFQRYKVKAEKERLRLEAYYSERQDKRNDDSNWFKFATGIVVGLIGVFTFFLKAKKA